MNHTLSLGELPRTGPAPNSYSLMNSLRKSLVTGCYKPLVLAESAVVAGWACGFFAGDFDENHTGLVILPCGPLTSDLNQIGCYC